MELLLSYLEFQFFYKKNSISRTQIQSQTFPPTITFKINTPRANSTTKDSSRAWPGNFHSPSTHNAHPLSPSTTPSKKFKKKPHPPTFPTPDRQLDRRTNAVVAFDKSMHFSICAAQTAAGRMHLWCMHARA